MTVIHRRPGIASATTLTGITLAVALVHAIAPEWSRAAGLDVWNLPELRQSDADTSAQWEELRDAHDRLNRQVEASDHLVIRLIEGEMSLRVAVAELARINAGRTGFVTSLGCQHPEARTDETRLARYALHKAERFLERDPSRQAEVLARLEAEYAGLAVR